MKSSNARGDATKDRRRAKFRKIERANQPSSGNQFLSSSTCSTPVCFLGSLKTLTQATELTEFPPNSSSLPACTGREVNGLQRHSPNQERDAQRNGLDVSSTIELGEPGIGSLCSAAFELNELATSLCVRHNHDQGSQELLYDLRQEDCGHANDDEEEVESEEEDRDRNGTEEGGIRENGEYVDEGQEERCEVHGKDGTDVTNEERIHKSEDDEELTRRFTLKRLRMSAYRPRKEELLENGQQELENPHKAFQSGQIYQLSAPAAGDTRDDCRNNNFETIKLGFICNQQIHGGDSPEGFPLNQNALYAGGEESGKLDTQAPSISSQEGSSRRAYLQQQTPQADAYPTRHYSTPMSQIPTGFGSLHQHHLHHLHLPRAHSQVHNHTTHMHLHPHVPLQLSQTPLPPSQPLQPPIPTLPLHSTTALFPTTPLSHRPFHHLQHLQLHPNPNQLENFPQADASTASFPSIPSHGLGIQKTGYRDPSDVFPKPEEALSCRDPELVFGLAGVMVGREMGTFPDIS
ncbi:unnamed protein product [Protopolystoma xenopodis]|uniref:Uncharacterized protein n=1 Tax=Protopolystoma xenopodis TaxID=117903 RepID=A0A448WC24_9PLAT|nr:unnamed protein product [Protopolystoma xenopodis]